MKRAPDLDSVLARAPMLRGLSARDFELTGLPGYTNRSYRLHNRDHDWVLRIPKPETNRYIDRAAEVFNQALASGLGIAPACAWHDASGITLTPTIASGRAVTRADFASAQMVQIILQPIRQLHRSGFEFRGQADLDALLTRYFSMLSASQQNAIRPRLAAARRLLDKLNSIDRYPVPSHNDLVLQNLLLDGERLWLIDWEYAAMASPYWDLATLCNAAALNRAQSAQLLQIYCEGGAPMKESVLFDYRELLQLLGDCWMAAFAHD